MAQTLVYGQVPVNEGELQVVLNPATHTVGEVVTMHDGSKYILARRYDGLPIAGGRHVDSRYAVWFLAVEVL